MNPSKTQILSDLEYYKITKVPKELQLKQNKTEIIYNESFINKAIQFLNLPTNSLSYKHCSDSESEISCKNVIKAFETIKGYEEEISVQKEDKKYLFFKHPIKGMGNKMETDVVCFLLALMSNRTVIIESNYPTNTQGSSNVKFEHIYEYPEIVITNRDNLPTDVSKNLKDYERSVTMKKTTIPTDSNWCCYDVIKNVVNSDSQFVTLDNLLYSSMVYLNEWTNAYAREHFGLHSVYFISNFFSRFPDFVINETNKTITSFLSNNNIEKDHKILGLHVRYHRAGQYYSHGLNVTLPTFFEEVDRRLSIDSKIIIALATDSEEAKEAFLRRYGENRIILSQGIAIRKADKDHVGAMLDMQLLSFCSELIVTYRSTFSFIVVARTGHNAWHVEKESPHSFPGSNSQCCGISMIYHHRDHCDWRTNDRVKYCSQSQGKAVLSYFNDFII